MNPYLHEHGIYILLGDRPIRAYASYPINNSRYQDFDPEIFARTLRHHYPLSYPLTWCVYERQDAVIVNSNDLRAYETHHRLPPTYHIPSPFDDQQHSISVPTYDDEVEIQESYVDQQMEDQLNESFLESLDVVARSGLTKKEISKNLRLTRYSKDQEEEGGESDICVVCQVEFERNERLGVLQCDHMYHPTCITRWLIRQNVCPLCKAQGLRV